MSDEVEAAPPAAGAAQDESGAGGGGGAPPKAAMRTIYDGGGARPAPKRQGPVDPGVNALSAGDRDELLHEARSAWEARGRDTAAFSLDKMIALWQQDDKEATATELLEKRRRIRQWAPRGGNTLDEREIAILAHDFLGHVGRNMRAGLLAGSRVRLREMTAQLLRSYAQLRECDVLQDAQRDEVVRRVRARRREAKLGAAAPLPSIARRSRHTPPALAQRRAR